MPLSPEEEAFLQALDEDFARQEWKKQYVAQDQARNNAALTQDMSPVQNLFVGMGSGMTRAIKGLGNMVGMVSDEALNEQDALDRPLNQSTAANIGQMIGSAAPGILATAGVAATGGLLPAAVTGAASSAPGWLKGGAKAATMLADNAIQGASTAAPDEQGSAAATGAVLGPMLSGFGRGLSRTRRGLVEKSDEYGNLTMDTAASHARAGAAAKANGQSLDPIEQLFVPISQGARKGGLSGAVGSIYRNAIPYGLGAEGQLTRQADEATNLVRQQMMQSGAPPGFVVPKVDRDNIADVMDMMKQQHAQVYQDLRTTNVLVPMPTQFQKDLRDAIRAADPQLPKSAVDDYVARASAAVERWSNKPSSNRHHNAYGLFKARQEITSDDFIRPAYRNNAAFERAREATTQYFNGLVNTTLRTTANSQKKDTLRTFINNADAYENFRPVRSASERAKAERMGGEFDIGAVINEARPGSRVHQQGLTAARVLENPAARMSQQGRMMNYPTQAATAAVGQSIGIPQVLGGITGITGINALAATKGAQKALYGDTAFQQALSRALRNNPNATFLMNEATRRGLTNTVTGEN